MKTSFFLFFALITNALLAQSNLKSSEIDLIIQDQVPLTTNPEITIEKSIIGKGALDEKTGLVEWKLKLKAKENQTFDYEFKVRHPKDKVVQI